MEIVKQNASQLDQVLKENENLRSNQEQIRLEFVEFRDKFNEIIDRQKFIENKLVEIEGCVGHAVKILRPKPTPVMIDKFVNTDQKENRPWTPILDMAKIHQPKTIEPVILPSPTELTTTTPVRQSIGTNNPNMKQLFNKYEIDDSSSVTTNNRRCVDFSVSSLSYMQRHGLLDGNKFKK